MLNASKSNWQVHWVKWFAAYAFTHYFKMSLPTEAQWEYAAKGAQQLEYPTDNGTVSATKANYNGDIPEFYNPNGYSVSVGSYAANPFELYDMDGSV